MIRPALTEEFPQLLEIQIGCTSGLTKTYKADEIKAWTEYLKREGADRYATYNNRVFVDDADTIAGFVSWSTDESEQSAAIECLYKLAAYQGKGIGSLLLKEAEDSIPDGTIIHVRSTLSARQFYERNGYVHTGDAVSRAGFAIALLEKQKIDE